MSLDSIKTNIVNSSWNELIRKYCDIVTISMVYFLLIAFMFIHNYKVSVIYWLSAFFVYTIVIYVKNYFAYSR
jgi:hypothetical protein